MSYVREASMSYVQSRVFGEKKRKCISSIKNAESRFWREIARVFVGKTRKYTFGEKGRIFFLQNDKKLICICNFLLGIKYFYL